MLDTPDNARAYAEVLRSPAGITERQCHFIEIKAKEAARDTGAVVPDIATYHTPRRSFRTPLRERVTP